MAFAKKTQYAQTASNLRKLIAAKYISSALRVLWKKINLENMYVALSMHILFNVTNARYSLSFSRKVQPGNTGPPF